MGHMTLTTPLSGIIFHQQADMANIIIYTKFVASLWGQAAAGRWGQAAAGAKLQATNRVPRPVDRGTATRYGG